MAARRSSVSSPSRKPYSSWRASLQSDMGVVRGGSSQVALHGELVQPLLERLSSPMETTHHRTNRDVEDLGDLLVGEPLDVGQQHRHAEVLGQRLQRLLHLGVGEPLEQLVLGAATC